MTRVVEGPEAGKIGVLAFGREGCLLTEEWIRQNSPFQRTVSREIKGTQRGTRFGEATVDSRGVSDSGSARCE